MFLKLTKNKINILIKIKLITIQLYFLIIKFKKAQYIKMNFNYHIINISDIFIL